MKSTVLCICLWCSLVSHAQEKLLVKGHFSKKHYERELDDKAGNLIFVLEKGDVILPKAIYMFELSPVNAQRLKQETVRVIPFFDDEICQNHNTEFTLEIIPIPNGEGAYYSKKIYNGEEIIGEYSKDYEEAYPSAYQRLKRGEEVLYREITEWRDLRDISQWIEHLNCADSVSVIGEMHWDGYDENGRAVGGTDYFTERMPFSIVAKKRLEALAGRFRDDFPAKENATQEEWRAWLQATLATLPADTACRHRTLSFPYTKDGYSKEMHYAYDKMTGKHFILGTSALGDKQLMQLDTERFTTQFLPVEGVPLFKDFYVENDDLYTVNSNFVWKKHAKTGNGPYQKEKESHLFSVPDDKNHLLSTLFTSNTLYLIYAYYSEKEMAYIDQKVMCVDTKTGEKLSDLDLASLLPAGEKITDFSRWHNNKALLTRFPVVVKTSRGGYYHFLIERDRSIKTSFLGSEYPYVWNFVDTDPPFYLDNEHNKLYKMDICEKENKKLLFSVSSQRMNLIFAIPDEKYLNVFYASTDAFTDRIMLQKLEKHTLESVGEPICIYSQAILENRSSENLPSYVNAFKSSQGWNLVFLIKDRNTFHWVQVPE